MPVGLNEPDNLFPVAGVKLASVAAGIKKNNQLDLVVFYFEGTVNCAATFTTNAFCAAPVILAKKHLSNSAVRALLINSGNANAGTGDLGLRNAELSCELLANQLGIKPENVLPFSTGVIGEQLPMPAIESGIRAISPGLAPDNWLDAANGIKTTDIVAKAISKQIELNGKTVTISGIAKGSGMICPDMATMLSFIATDADIDQAFLQDCLTDAVNNSFNAITVDGDTSTNDACVLTSTGKAGNKQLVAGSDDAPIFCSALNDLCQYLAQSIIRDGEGATKFVTIQVEQSASHQEARDVAYTIAHSPLVKTALFASDPNWGRILAAVGRAGIKQFDIGRVEIYLDEVCIVSNGAVDDAYTEKLGQRVMSQDEFCIRVVLGRGSHHTTLWTTDLSHEYVRINSEYRS